MLAQFRVLLPHIFSIPEGEQLTPFEFPYPPYLVRVSPPLALDIDTSVPLIQISRSLRSASPAPATNAVLVQNIPTLRGNVLQIEFIKQDFDRRPREIGSSGGEDPPASVIFFIVNTILDHIRVVIAASHIKRLDPETSIWYLRYLTDDGQELAEDPALARGRANTSFKFNAAVLNSINWPVVAALPVHYALPTWYEILLDAGNLLPEVGPSLVLAAAAMETLIGNALDQLARRSTVRPELWSWINGRPDWRQDPTVEEQFDSLLRLLTGRSLKEEPILWETFRNLRTARNKFMHEGRATIGGQEITQTRARELVAQANAIGDWIEQLLPLELHRPINRQDLAIQINHPLT